MQIVYTRQDCETGTTYHALQSSISVGCALKLNYNIEYVLLNIKINKALREKIIITTATYLWSMHEAVRNTPFES